MSFEGIVVDGKAVFDGPLPLPDGTPIRVEAVNGSSPKAEVPFLRQYKEALDKAEDASSQTLLEVLGDLVGKAEGLPEDAARNVDHYLYGHPKQ